MSLGRGLSAVRSAVLPDWATVVARLVGPLNLALRCVSVNVEADVSRPLAAFQGAHDA
jgi:hypothetical protein